MKNILPFCFVAILASCGSSDSAGSNASAAGKDSVVAAKGDSAAKVGSESANATSGAPAWGDSLVIRYIGAQDPSLHPMKTISMYDRIEKTDTASYYVYSVGHDAGDSTQQKYIIETWLYLDSASHIAYTYDVIEDKLTKWSK